MHILAVPSLSELALMSPSAMNIRLGNTTGAFDYTLELFPIHYTRMLDRTSEFVSIGGVNTTVSPMCVLNSMVVLLQITLVIRGIVMSREVRPFVVYHLRSLSEDYLRLTPLWYPVPFGGAVVE